MTPVLFVLAAGLGAATRLRINQFGWTWVSTLIANVIGSFALGWMLAGDPSDQIRTIVGTAYLGSLTTFSMVALEVADGPPRRRIAIIVCNLAFGLAAATVGHSIG